ncbi:MAG: response regulator [Parvularculaceae bacterium]
MLSSIDVSAGDEAGAGATFAARPQPIRPRNCWTVSQRFFSVRRRKIPSPPSAPPAPCADAQDERVEVLVCEDNEVNRVVMLNMLGDDYKLIFAENGRIGVDMFLERAPAIILMDLSMPVMDGLDATRCIRRLEAEKGLPRTPIIATTAHVLDQDRDKCRLAGMDDFVAKPVRKDVLETIVSRWVMDAIEWDCAESA